MERFDANTYIKLTKALDRFDLVGETGLEATFKEVKAKVLVMLSPVTGCIPPNKIRKLPRHCCVLVKMLPI